MLLLAYNCAVRRKFVEALDENKKYANENQVVEQEDGTYILRNQYQRGVAPITTGEDGKRYDANGALCDAQGFVLNSSGARIPITVFEVEDTDGIDGVQMLETKINLARNWFREQWGIELDDLRNAVQSRLQSFDASTLEDLRQQVYGQQ